MGKVNHKAEILKIKDVHPARCLRCRRDKRFQRYFDVVGFKVVQVGCQCGSQHILNHKRHGASKRYRY